MTIPPSNQVFNSIDLRRKIFHFKSLPKKKQVQENQFLEMEEFKNHIKSYVHFFNEWNTVPSWIEDEDYDEYSDEEQWQDFVDIVNDIYNSNSS